MSTPEIPDAPSQRLADAWRGAKDVHDAVRHAEDWPEEWCAVVIDAAAGRQYLGSDRPFTRYRGNSRRFPTQADALTAANNAKNATHRTTELPLHPWIRSVDAELVKTKGNPR